MLTYFYKKRYVEPFLLQLEEAFKDDNIIVYTDYFKDDFLVIVCINHKIIEITKTSQKSLIINENNFQEWVGYKAKILLMKEKATLVSFKNAWSYMGENLRAISQNYLLNCLHVKEILTSTLLNIPTEKFKSSIELSLQTNNTWVD